jgi:ribonuclease HI
MERDWLLAIPRGKLATQEAILREWLAADPAAAEIPEDEAAQFMAAARLVRYLDPKVRPPVWAAVGVRVLHSGEKAIRRATIMVLRRWRDEKARALLMYLVHNTGLNFFPDVAEHPDAWTDELFARAYRERLDLMWLVEIRRYLGKEGDLTEWLQGLGEYAERHYQVWLAAGRLTLRQLVYAEADPVRLDMQVAASAQTDLAQDLRAKDRQSGALRQDVRRHEHDRKQLLDQARRSEREAREMLSQARGEVAVARRALNEQLAVQDREVADQARRFEAELGALRQRMAEDRTEFFESLWPAAPLRLLQGRTITVAGQGADHELYRQMVESIGGSYAPDGGEVLLSAPSRPSDLEQDLRRLALQQVLVKCDGLYRKKRNGQWGIAMSGFQVFCGDELIWERDSVVCCGPVAGSLMAEYAAVAMAMSWLKGVGLAPGSTVEIWSDCKTMHRLVRRQGSARPPQGCVTLDDVVRRLWREHRERGSEVRLCWVPRDEVHTADRLCARAYWGLTWYHRPQGRVRAPLEAFLRSSLGGGGYGDRRASGALAL